MISSKIFFSSDHYFGHENIIKYCNRPFNSVEKMNEEMINRWNSVVNKKDDVFYLGDFSLSKEYIKSISQKLNGSKFIIPGNHDECHSSKCKNQKKVYEMIEFYKDYDFHYLGEKLIYELKDYNLNLPKSGLKVNLCHMPYFGDHTDTDRYENFRPRDDGKFLLHGHVHDKWKTNGRMINVGVDVWDFYPVSIEKIAKEIVKIKDEK